MNTRHLLDVLRVAFALPALPRRLSQLIACAPSSSPPSTTMTMACVQSSLYSLLLATWSSSIQKRMKASCCSEPCLMSTWPSSWLKMFRCFRWGVVWDLDQVVRLNFQKRFIFSCHPLHPLNPSPSLWLNKYPPPMLNNHSVIVLSQWNSWFSKNGFTRSIFSVGVG